MAKPLTIGQCDSCDTRIVLVARRCPGCKVGYMDIEADIQAALVTIGADRERIKALVWLVGMKDRGLQRYSMPTHEGCLGEECACMPGRALALTEADWPGTMDEEAARMYVEDVKRQHDERHPGGGA